MDVSSKQYITRRRFYLIIFFIFLWIFLFIPDKGYGQTITTGDVEYQSWYSKFGARSAAMANATVADPLGRNGLYSNPATLTFSDNTSSVIGHSLYNSSRNFLLANVTTTLRRNQHSHLAGAFTFQRSVMRQDSFINPGQLHFTHLELTVGYAWLITSSLSAGLMLNSIFGKTATNSVWTKNARLGFLYAPTSLISYGLVYKGTGYTKGWLGAEPIYYLNEDNETIVSSVTAPHRLELGITLRFPSWVQYPDFVLSFSNEKIFGADGLIYRGGMEVYLQNIIALRGGYFLGPSTQGARIGFGFLLDTFKIDYAFAPNSANLTGKSHQFSISLNF